MILNCWRERPILSVLMTTFVPVRPRLFGSAINNFGVQEMLDAFVELAPAPGERTALERTVRPEEEQFSGFVFKIQANMDPAHRDRIAFCASVQVNSPAE